MYLLVCLIVIFKVVFLVFFRGGGVSYWEVNDYNNYMYELEDIIFIIEFIVLISLFSLVFVFICMYKLLGFFFVFEVLVFRKFGLEGIMLIMEYIVLRSIYKYILLDVLSFC